MNPWGRASAKSPRSLNRWPVELRGSASAVGGADAVTENDLFVWRGVLPADAIPPRQLLLLLDFTTTYSGRDAEPRQRITLELTA